MKIGLKKKMQFQKIFYQRRLKYLKEHNLEGKKEPYRPD